jgi:hypothetical protein
LAEEEAQPEEMQQEEVQPEEGQPEETSAEQAQHEEPQEEVQPEETQPKEEIHEEYGDDFVENEDEAAVNERKINKPCEIKFILRSGKVNEKQDIFSKGDPYVRMIYGNEERKSEVEHNTLTPKWNKGIYTFKK